MENKSLEKIETVFDLSEIAEEKYPKTEKRFKARGVDLLNWDNKILAKMLNYFDESTYPNDFLRFWFKEKGEEKCATLYKGNYQDFECAYYLTIGKDTDLFNSKDELREFLEYLLRCE